MMDWTDRHCRYFHRLMTRRAMLYTEMVTAPAVIHGPKPRLLDYSPEEHPVALQLGGSDPRELAQAVRLVRDWGYDEINLNVGCPSDRVQSGCFGAVLMERPALVADCVAAMIGESAVPVTVKCRIGQRRRCHAFHHPRPQGLAAGLKSQGKPGYSATGLPAGSGREADLSASDDLYQRRYHIAGSGPRVSGSGTGRGDAGPRGLS
jgi:hypothetical protein